MYSYLSECCSSCAKCPQLEIWRKKRNASADSDFDFSFLFPNKSFSACIPMLDINILVDNPMETAKFIDTFLWLDVKRDMFSSFLHLL